jgi:hypothetical protein
MNGLIENNNTHVSEDTGEFNEINSFRYTLSLLCFDAFFVKVRNEAGKSVIYPNNAKSKIAFVGGKVQNISGFELTDAEADLIKTRGIEIEKTDFETIYDVCDIIFFK